jgi:hypothetical protein
MIEKLKQLFYKVNEKWKRRDIINALLLGKLHVERIKQKGIVSDLKEVEFQVFSQFGEDGIIQYIINNIEIPNKVFIEFGVENYLESNTRFLLLNDRWSGLVIDGSKAATDFIKKDELVYYRSDLTVANNFITRVNINDIISAYTQKEDIGLLSIDIDGNDYWIFEVINVIKPRIIICEFNGLFGKDYKVTVPYKEDFYRLKEHYSFVYYGASLNALIHLAKEKGYDYIGCGSQGLNAFFVRSNINHSFVITNAAETYKSSMHKEFRNVKGEILHVNYLEQLSHLKNMDLWDIEHQKIKKITDIYF